MSLNDMISTVGAPATIVIGLLWRLWKARENRKREKVIKALELPDVSAFG